ncbi:hypothetical protein LCGC14_2640340 [marine sediment metagenome]|uniref:GS catalytic domain-containing protein n=1 Tax=marine sediment metagenome TaxID=412755 RepID=A0A0F9C8E6_9ZZZZ
MTLLIGQDTELFLKKNDKFISAHGVIPGSKEQPYPVKRGAVQVDGMALEFNTFPAKSFTAFKMNINTVLSRLQDMIPDDCEMTVCPTAHFDAKYIEDQPEEARLLGCDPDYNAYTKEMNLPPTPSPVMRTAAGHIHLGWTEGKNINDPSHMHDCITMVKQLDYCIGVPSVIHDSDTERRQMYGQAGAFRPKSYGVEYRVLSNYWISHENYMKEVFDNCKKAYEDLERGKIWEDVFKGHSIYSAQKVINSGDVGKAITIMDVMKLKKVRGQ